MASAHEPTVFVVDDNRAVRQSLAELMRSSGLAVETFADGAGLLAAWSAERPGCLLLDVRLGGGQNGLDLQDELARRGARLPIIVLTGHGTVSTSVRALKAGAIDFLQKPVRPAQLVKRVREAIDLDRRARAAAAVRDAVDARLRRLTPREREIAELLLDGLISKEVAARLKVSPRTVEGHRRAILRKMGVGSVAQLVKDVVAARAARR